MNSVLLKEGYRRPGRRSRVLEALPRKLPARLFSEAEFTEVDSVDPPDRAIRPEPPTYKVLRQLKVGKCFDINWPMQNLREHISGFRKKYDWKLQLVLRPSPDREGWTRIWRLEDYDGPCKYGRKRKTPIPESKVPPGGDVC